MKRFFAMITCVCLIFSLFSSNVVMVNAVTTEGCYKYSISNGEVIIEEYIESKGVTGELIIPSKLGGYPVTEIKAGAFYHTSYLTSVVIPGSIKKIGASAFSLGYRLEKVVLEEGVTEIGENAFKDSNIISITIPKSLKKIKTSAFQFCRKIEEVYITDLKAWCEIEIEGDSTGPFNYNGKDYSATSPGYIKASKLYLNNKLITELIIPEGVTRIYTDAFHGCNSITKVVIPASVIRVDAEAFKGCKTIRDVWYTGSESESNKIRINYENDCLMNASWHYNSCPIGAPHSYDNDCDSSCNVCSKVRTISGHSYDNACDTSCNICNEIRTVPHAYGEWGVTKQASCTESGLKTRECEVCSKTETEIIYSRGHDFSSEWTIDKKATCTVAGSKSNHCTRCSATTNNTTISVSGHSWGKWTTEKKATDKTEGLSVRICGECSLKETKTIAKLAKDDHIHKFGEWQINSAATCKEKGSAIRICSVCNEQEQKELLATGHQVGEWKEISPTCTNEGVRERTCVVCNETEKIVINASGHELENLVVIKEPTDKENGLSQGKCKSCGEEITQEIPALLSDSDNISSTVSNKNTVNAIKNNKEKNDNWIIWISIGIVVLVIISFSVYLILKEYRKNIVDKTADNSAS